MSARVRIINGKGDWGATPPTGADDHDLQSLGDDFIGSGGVVRLQEGEGLVTELASPVMKVSVAPGTIYVPNSSWTPTSFEPQYYIVVRDADEEVDISSNPSGQTRYDAICQSIDKVTTPDDTASNVSPIIVVEGTPGETSIDLPDDITLLAIVEVADGATSITDGEITDYRTKVFIEPGASNPGFQTVSDASTVNFDCEYGKYNKFFVEITGDRTFTFSHVPVGFPFIIYVQQGSGGNHVPTLPTNISNYGANIVFSSVAGEIDALGVILLPTNDYSIVPVAVAQS